LHILLAEDNPVNQEVMQEVLIKAGHSVHLAMDGEQALDALAGEVAFDLVMLDMNMPKASGLEVLRKFRFMDTSARTPVLMLSADVLPETIRECMQSGANDYITKPVQITSLLAKVAEFSGGNNDDEDAGCDASGPDPEQNSLLDEDMLDDLFNLIRSPEKRKHLLHSFESSGEEHLAQLDIFARQNDKTMFLEQVHAVALRFA